MNKTQWNRTVPKKHRVLMLRTCAADMTSYGSFVWPVKGYVEAPDWCAEPVCGGGLHGALWGEGDGTLLSWATDAMWLVVEVDDRQIIDLYGKIKVPRGWVLYAGDRLTATGMMPVGKAVIGGTATAGDGGNATAGYRGTATAGHHGTATAGHHGTATAGDGGNATTGYGGTATAGDDGTATAGDHGNATAGHSGNATAGYRGTATAGHHGTATAGHHGTATAGYRGTVTAGDHGNATAGYRGIATAGDGGNATAGYRGMATAGDGGTATAGYYGTATAGDGGNATAGNEGQIRIKWWDGTRYRLAVGYVGEDGIEADVAYHVVDGKLVPKDL